MSVATRLHTLHASGENDPYPVKLTLELTQWESLNQLIEFLRAVRDSANGGHGFRIEADRQDLGDKAPYVYIDGDGNDKIGRIVINGVDVTEKGEAKDIFARHKVRG